MPVSSINHQEFHDKLKLTLNEKGLSEINIVFADHWYEFQQGLKTGNIGIYFAPPHFAAWAINQNKFTPLLRIAEPISFVIAAKKAQSEIFELNDLIGRTVCTQSPLNIDYLLTTESFNRRAGSASIKFVRHVGPEMYNAQTECDGFVVSNHVLQKMQLEGNDDYIRLHQGQNYSNYAFIAHPSINSTVSRKLQQLFIQTDIQVTLHPLLRLFANEVTLISSKADDYPQSYTQALKKHWR